MEEEERKLRISRRKSSRDEGKKARWRKTK